MLVYFALIHLTSSIPTSLSILTSESTSLHLEYRYNTTSMRFAWLLNSPKTEY